MKQLNNAEMKARFLQQIAGTGVVMKCTAKSFQLPDMILNGVLLNDKQERTLYLTNDKGYSDFYDIDEWIPELTPLEHITDEHLMCIANILGSDFKIEGGMYSVSITLQSIKEALIEALNLDTINLPVHAIDFLRYNGYAIDWNGHSVKELIEADYCQLRKGGEQDG